MTERELNTLYKIIAVVGGDLQKSISYYYLWKCFDCENKLFVDKFNAIPDDQIKRGHLAMLDSFKLSTIISLGKISDNVRGKNDYETACVKNIIRLAENNLTNLFERMQNVQDRHQNSYDEFKCEFENLLRLTDEKFFKNKTDFVRKTLRNKLIAHSDISFLDKSRDRADDLDIVFAFNGSFKVVSKIVDVFAPMPFDKNTREFLLYNKHLPAFDSNVFEQDKIAFESIGKNYWSKVVKLDL